MEVGGDLGRAVGEGRITKSNQNSSHKIPKEPIGDIRKKKKRGLFKDLI